MDRYEFCRTAAAAAAAPTAPTVCRGRRSVDNYNYDNNRNAFVFGEFSTLEGAAGSGC